MNISSFLLSFVFLLTLYSCQKSSVKNEGFFTQIAKKYEASRSIASVNIKASTQQDPLQVLIYCKATQINEKDCFKNFYKDKLTSSFFETNTKLLTITQKFILSQNKKIKEQIENRRKFCDDNSISRYRKCLFLNLKKNSISVVNELNKENKMNGYEYIYLKQKIKEEIVIGFNEVLSLKKTK